MTGRVVFEDQSEPAMQGLAGALARQWRARADGSLLVGLSGVLGAGKTTWVRGLLAGLGYHGRVPSPTYTLLEHYALEGLEIVHVDLYRLGEPGTDSDLRGELEALGLGEWLARERCWALVEWPERSATLLGRCDVRVELELGRGPDTRRVTIEARPDAPESVLEGLQLLAESTSS